MGQGKLIALMGKHEFNSEKSIVRGSNSGGVEQSGRMGRGRGRG